MPKYNNKKTKVDGIEFDSKAEAKYYELLKKLKAEGKVLSFSLQPKFLLQDSFTKNGKKYRAVWYVADFDVRYPDGRREIVDIKGQVTETAALKFKLFEYNYPGLILVLLKDVKKYGGFITLDEYKKRKREEAKK